MFLYRAAPFLFILPDITVMPARPLNAIDVYSCASYYLNTAFKNIFLRQHSV